MRNDYPNLDLLRTNAVLIVFVTHLISGLNHFAWPVVETIGFYGVLIFFVHTSLVLMMSLDRHSGNENRAIFVPFIVRRVFRIYPLAVFAVLTSYIFHLPLAGMDANGFSGLHWTKLDLFSNLLLVQNLTLATPVPFVLWSLPYEMQMYLFLPAMSAISRKTSSLVPFLMIAILGRAAAHVPLPQPLIGVSDLFSYVPYFIPGVMAFQMMKDSRRGQLPWWLWQGVIYLGLIPLLCLPHLAPVIACFTVGLLVPFFSQAPQGALSKAAAIVARYSYGIYLTHAWCIWLAFYRYGSLSWSFKWSIFLLSAVALPVILYHSLEAPMIRLGGQAASRIGTTKSRTA